MSLLRSLVEVKAKFGAGVATLEFNEVSDDKGVRVGIRSQGGKFIERPTWTSLNDIIRNMGGHYSKEDKCWVVPILQSSLPPPSSTSVPQKQPPASTSVQKPPVTSPSVDPNEKKYLVEDLARLLDERPPRTNSSWMEDAMVAVAHALLLLLEEKK